jgi:hypothetical protein
VVLFIALRKQRLFRGESWRVTLAVAAGTIIIVSIFGGAELERYLLPVLPVFYIAVSIALTFLPRRASLSCAGALLVALIANLFWNPPYPFPYENNFTMVDFVRLQQMAANFAEQNLAHEKIATAWPYSAGLQDSDYGFVHHKLNVIETNDFHPASIWALPANSFDALITYDRTWAPPGGVVALSLVRKFLERFYDWHPDITPEQCRALDLWPIASWKLRGQEIDVYVRGRLVPVRPIPLSQPRASAYRENRTGSTARAAPQARLPL